MDSFEGTDQHNRLFQVVLTEGCAVWKQFIATSTEGCNVTCLIHYYILKVIHPDRITLIYGNHGSRQITQVR